jgi:hypothetical protein
MENKLAPRIAIYYRAAPGKYQFQAGKAPGKPDWQLKVQCEGAERDCEVSAESIVDFANCSDEIEAVQGFIQKHGPPFEFTRKDAGYVYADTLGGWKSKRAHFCTIWDRMIGVEVRNDFTAKYGREFPELSKAQPPWRDAEARGVFRLTGAGPIFVAETLSMAMVAKLLMTAYTGKLRRCLNPDCALTRYFIADHGKTQYCSEECGRWGQRKAKLKYWHERNQEAGTELLRSQSIEKHKPNIGHRRLKSGSQKAR